MKPIFSSFHSLHSPLLHPPLPLHRRPRWPRMDSSTPHQDSSENKAKLIVIMGATGTGKSRLSIDLSSRFPHSQIINSDKMQLYNGLDITTNKIPLHERKGVPHFLLGEFDSIDADVAPSQFRSSAGLTIANIVSRGNLPFLVGGSNSFIHALLVETFDSEVDVFAGSGSVSHVLRYDCCFLWVDVAWSVLCDYLCKRVDEMLDSGMFEELAQFYAPDKESVRVGLRKAIGVPEFDGYFRKYPPWESEENGMVPEEGCDPVRREAYEEAVREIQDNTCRLAKRQIGKILRLIGAGWDLRRLDATATFGAVMRKKKSSSSDLEWRDIWEREVVEPSVKIVKRFLEE
ncbi:adenylate isopentenyltransferase [Herrania umbratica]|uniref:adenylate dimethylallyltransferase (ADP/ATP-dependent) n=1 Tax=Herrania umbratica TaxID=108875 RepID=A0A6J1BHC5_9ROSI|nr:adenylate isopentenyltransferase [Herrania umbratica]XP_021298850.1 adenylate isopentenyltransferase [Herrania umbratica]XP_021298851.1 adenylate isopentenyltransferase [Herrania umbratica]